jgi:hypothetical protein
MKNLINKKATVIKENNITIIIDYPLSVSYKFELNSQSGFSRDQIVTEISNHYYQLYEEERTATIKTIPQKQRKFFNGNETDGKYGIWGHDIGDLVLDEISVYKTSTGKIFLTLQLES